MQNNTARFKRRSITLENCFSKNKMLKAWKTYVRNGLRKQDILDLYDYFEFHSNREQYLEIISSQIVEGKYRPKTPHLVRIEKKHGVCRHLQIPTPDDALVLQTLVENLGPAIEKAQPTKRAYYSRSHGGPKSEEDIDESFPYQWWELWPEFQKRIYEFTTTHNFIVVTDIANYYDNISFRHLRHELAGMDAIDEGLLDFLFYMLEAFVWRPDYLPISGIGLPQINFDAPRLLGHAYLFEVDTYLDTQTKGNFVRWMDDIDFGVQTVEEGKKILRDLDELLLTRGVRLNMGKTKILSKEQAKEYFLPDENRFLTILQKRIIRILNEKADISEEREILKTRFRTFWRLPDSGRWEKVLQRYFSLFGLMNDNYLDKYVPDLLRDRPSVRNSIIRYYHSVRPNKQRFGYLRDFFISNHCEDDASLFAIAKTFVDWKLPSGSLLRKEIVNMALETANLTATNFIASLWMLAKYGEAEDLFKIIHNNSKVWRHSNFISRQVASVVPLLRKNESELNKILSIFRETGQVEAFRILVSYNEKRRRPLMSADRLYLLHGSGEIDFYPLSKFLIAYNWLTNKELSETDREAFRQTLIDRIPDPLYKYKLKSIVF